jgi:hypothetical protein
MVIGKGNCPEAEDAIGWPQLVQKLAVFEFIAPHLMQYMCSPNPFAQKPPSVADGDPAHI